MCVCVLILHYIAIYNQFVPETGVEDLEEFCEFFFFGITENIFSAV